MGHVHDTNGQLCNYEILISIAAVFCRLPVNRQKLAAF